MVWRGRQAVVETGARRRYSSSARPMSRRNSFSSSQVGSHGHESQQISRSLSTCQSPLPPTRTPYGIKQDVRPGDVVDGRSATRLGFIDAAVLATADHVPASSKTGIGSPRHSSARLYHRSGTRTPVGVS